MKLQQSNTYFGVTTESLRTENFNISLTNHSANSKISLHSHNKPYLCLLASGTYKEESNNTGFQLIIFTIKMIF